MHALRSHFGQGSLFLLLAANRKSRVAGVGQRMGQSQNITFQSYIFEKWKDFQKWQNQEIRFELAAEVNSDMAY